LIMEGLLRMRPVQVLQNSLYRKVNTEASCSYAAGRFFQKGDYYGAAQYKGKGAAGTGSVG